MAEKKKPKSEEEMKMEKMLDVFQQVLFKWIDTCGEAGLTVSCLISIGVHGFERIHGDSWTYKHGLADSLQDHLTVIKELLAKQKADEIGIKDFN